MPLPQGLALPDPPPLPAPPLLERLAFEQPWPVTLALLAAGLGAYLVLNARGRPGRGGAIAGLLAILAGAHVITAVLIRTARERMIDVASRLVDRVATGDADGVALILLDDARLEATRYFAQLDRDQILARVSAQFGTGGGYQAHEHDIVEITASRDGSGVGRVLLKVRVVPEASRVPVFSWWQLDTRAEQPDQWRVRGITLISVSGAGSMK